MPTVSIIVPARNEERVIYRSLSSLLNQSYPNYEIIAIDDNSSDNTLKLMQKVKAEHCRSVKPLSEDELQDQPQQFVSELHSNKSPININNSSTEIAKGGKEILTLTVSLPTSVNTETNSNDKLKIISLKGKPKDWTAKTWASHQGFLHSKGEIIIFTDADTYYVDKDMIAKSISYLQSENLDVLTGFPLIELKDFWSRVICPVWKLFGTVFGCNLSDINDPRSDAANLNGCFIVIGRKIFQDLGTYEAVRDSIREDEALGRRAKQFGYRIMGVCMEKSLTALWSRDFRTLWWGIARTIIPIFRDKRRKAKVVSNVLLLFLMGMLPFMIFPYALNISTVHSSALIMSHPEINPNLSRYLFDLVTQFQRSILPLDLSACVMLFVGSAIIARLEFKISAAYAIISPISAIFLVIAYAAHIFSIELVHRDEGTIVKWQGRKYVFPNK